VTRTEYDGSITVLANSLSGQTAQCPKRRGVHPDGGIWFTDPGYGSLMHYEGTKGELALKEAVYRIDPHTGALALVTDALAKPNGLCFSRTIRNSTSSTRG
jgi:gluconolactonase